MRSTDVLRRERQRAAMATRRSLRIAASMMTDHIDIDAMLSLLDTAITAATLLLGFAISLLSGSWFSPDNIRRLDERAQKIADRTTGAGTAKLGSYDLLYHGQVGRVSA